MKAILPHMTAVVCLARLLLLSTIYTSLTSPPTFAQGQIIINNHVIPGGVDARIVLATDPPGYSSVGSPDWSVEFFGGPHGSPITDLKPLDPRTAGFRGPAGSIAAGYFDGGGETVPDVPYLDYADILLVVHGPSGYSHSFGPFTVRTNFEIPTIVPLGTSPLVLPVPELGTGVLMSLGFIACFIVKEREPPAGANAE